MEAISSPRWRRRKTARPQEILEAALACFAERGFATTRMEDIALRAGVTKGTIYLYFENKEAVFKALVRESIGVRVSEALELMRNFKGSSRELIRAVLGTIGEFMQTSDRAVLPKIILSEAGNFPELLRFYREEIIDPGLAAMTGVIARGVASGEFRKVVPEYGARLCIAPILLSAVWRTTFAQFDDTPFDYQKFLETHLDVLLRGLAAEKAN